MDMNRQLFHTCRHVAPWLPLLVLSLGLLTGCDSGTSYQVVEIQSEDDWMSLSTYDFLIFSGVDDDASPYFLLQEGDFLIGVDENLFLPVLPSDTGTLVLDVGDNRCLLNGEVVTLSLRHHSEDDWAWLESATPEELGALRMIEVSAHRAADSTRVMLPPQRVSILEGLAAVNPNLAVTTGYEVVLPQLLQIFDPSMLDLTNLEMEPEFRALLGGEPNLKTVILSGDEINDLDFLARIRRLEKVVLAEWDPGDTGSFPDSLPNLKSLFLLFPEFGSLDVLGTQPGLEELMVWGCEVDDETEEPVDISALSRYPKLEMVALRSCFVSEDLSPLDGLEKLERLSLPWLTTQEQMEHIVRTHPNLRVLETIQAEGLTDLTPLTELSKLEALLAGGSAPPDPLFGMDQLKYLAVLVDHDELPSYEEELLPQLQAELPGTAITRLDELEFCLGSGFILLLFPLVGGAWWATRRRERRKLA